VQTYFKKHLFKSIRLHEIPAVGTSLIVVIPCFNEPDVANVLASLNRCHPCKRSVEVIVVINSASNASEEIKDQNEKTFQQVVSWQGQQGNIRFRLFILRDEDLPPKHAGVGLARKIGMDEAAFRFESNGKKEGVIVCLDADCTVAENYLEVVEEYFSNHPNAKAASIYFEHMLTVSDKASRHGIINYELHLRYYVQALRYAGYPYAFHTIGSGMCVRSDVYQQAGGMNRRKAGEDFYFLHKIIPLGGFGEINATTVFPSSRVSERVPFGTGRAMKEWLAECSKEFFTYDIRIFEELRLFIQSVPLFYQSKSDAVEKIVKKLPRPVQAFLSATDFLEKVDEINSNTSGAESFRQRFFNWLDGFRVLKMIHFMRDNYHQNIPLGKAAKKLLDKTGTGVPSDEESLLEIYREMDKAGKL